jgi:hypothetical protein
MNSKENRLIISLFCLVNLIIFQLAINCYLPLNSGFVNRLFFNIISFSIILPNFLLIAILALLMRRIGLNNVIKSALIATFSLVNLYILSDILLYLRFNQHIDKTILLLVVDKNLEDILGVGHFVKEAFYIFCVFILLAEYVVFLFLEKRYKNTLWKHKSLIIVAIFTFILSICTFFIIKDAFTNYNSVAENALRTRNANLKNKIQFSIVKTISVTSHLVKFAPCGKMIANIQSKGEYIHAGLTEQHAFSSIYPLTKPTKVKALTSYPNILVILVDAWRFDDMLIEQVMPNTVQFAKKTLNFANHYSNTNNTQSGVHSLFYSNSSHLFHVFAQTHIRPVILEALSGLNYDFYIDFAAATSWPRFDDNVFYKIQTKSELKSGRNGLERDVSLTNNFLDYLQARDSKKHFFAYLHYDTIHDRFAIESYTKKMSNSKYSSDHERELKRMQISGTSVDNLLGKIFNNKKFQSLLNNTIVVITGDHGSETLEFGKMGHASQFSIPQVKVPFIVHIPKVAPKVLTYTTQHFDFVPTLLELLGYKSDHYGYSLGKSMLIDNTKDDKIVYFTTAG